MKLYSTSSVRPYKIISFAIFAISLLLIFCDFAWSVTAAPRYHTLTQPDGTIFEARQWGDEWGHGWETVAGYTIIKNPSTSTWVYAILADDGTVAPTSSIVGKESAPANTPLHVRPIAKRKAIDKTIRLPNTIERYPKPQIPQSVVPSTGTGNIPVVMVNFSNTGTIYTSGEFSTMLFGTANNSMKDYYEEVSYGVFSVSPGPAGVQGWYTASNTHDYYGTNDIGGNDVHPPELVLEAIIAADATVNFAPYDQDGDCYVDVVAIVHQGNGEEASGTATDIWSHRWDLFSANISGEGTGIYTTDDTAACGSIKINDYIIQPEILNGGLQTIGVFAHEYGHALGLPDLYDTDSSSEGIGNWALMAAGSWNSSSRAGDSPAHLSAWSKYKLGWISPTLVNGTLTNESISEASNQADVYQLLNGSPSTGGEYFLIENRQKSGFDTGLPGVGLAIWHIDETQSNNDNECVTVTGCTNRYKVALEQSDGLFDLEKNNDRGDTGDLFLSGKDFAPGTTPNSRTYGGTDNQLNVTNISIASSSMTATIGVSATSPEPDCISQDPGFETGIPNSYWTETSTNFGTPICDLVSCGAYSANSGNWWAWFGGIKDVAEDGTLEQTVTIPNSVTKLTFYLAVPSYGTPGYLRLVLDGQQLWEVTAATASNYSSGYIQVSVDISTYADGGTHTLQFVSHTDASAETTNFLIDDICMDQVGNAFCWDMFLPAIMSK